MFNPASFRLSKLSLVLLSCIAWSIQGCSIENVVSDEIKISQSDKNIPQYDASDPQSVFVFECNKCIQGDLSNLPWIIKTYHSSFTASREYKPDQFQYQYIVPTQAYEKCAEKAKAMGDPSAFNQLIIKPARISRIARYFYIKKDYTQGAYWIQRVININGEKDGLYTAGRIFIQDMRTISIGVKLLEQSARLGNREARQMLLGLLQPGSTYYYSITQNTLLDDERSAKEKAQVEDFSDGSNINATTQEQLGATQPTEGISQTNSVSQLESKDTFQATPNDATQSTSQSASQGQLNPSLPANSSLESQARAASKAASEQSTQTLEQDESTLKESGSGFANDRERDSDAITRDSTIYENSTQASDNLDQDSDNNTPIDSPQTQELGESKLQPPLPARTVSVPLDPEAQAKLGVTENNIPISALPAKKLNERAERIKEVKAKADAAAAAAERQQKTE